jgi:pre-mRNA cleavage complex 2 protein Pcf11
LRTLLINGHPFKTEFGGMPMVIYVGGMKHFLRLSTLPNGVRAGKVYIKSMLGNQETEQGAGGNSPNQGNI